MRLVIPQETWHEGVRWTQRLLFAAGLVMLGYCGFVWLDSRMFETRAYRELDRAAASGPLLVVASSGLIGRIEIPRLGLSVAVMEGTDAPVLRRAAGHIYGTALPGTPGNVGIAGHRDTFFRPLKNIRENDVVVLITPAADYRYRVVSSRIVSPADVAVLNPTATEVLTLVTCYPFYYVGAAPSRFIVRAERVR